MNLVMRWGPRALLHNRRDEQWPPLRFALEKISPLGRVYHFAFLGRLDLCLASVPAHPVRRGVSTAAGLGYRT